MRMTELKSEIASRWSPSLLVSHAPSNVPVGVLRIERDRLAKVGDSVFVIAARKEGIRSRFVSFLQLATSLAVALLDKLCASRDGTLQVESLRAVTQVIRPCDCGPENQGHRERKRAEYGFFVNSFASFLHVAHRASWNKTAIGNTSH